MHSDLDPAFEQHVRRQLRALPTESPPPFDWREFQRRSRTQRRPHGWMAIAAGLAVVLAAGALVANRLAGHHSQAVLALRPAAPANDMSPRLDATRQWLASLPEEPAIVRVGSEVPIVDLEDRIALMDDALNAARVSDAHPGRVQALQRERAELLQSLVQVRYAETLATEAP